MQVECGKLAVILCQKSFVQHLNNFLSAVNQNGRGSVVTVVRTTSKVCWLEMANFDPINPYTRSSATAEKQRVTCPRGGG